MRKLILALAGLVAAYVFAGMLAHQRVVPPTELLRYSEADIPQAELLAASGGMAQQEGTLHTQMDGAYLDVTGIAAKVGPLASLTVQVDVSNAAALSQPTRFKVYYAAPGEDFSERRTLVQPPAKRGEHPAF